MNIPLAFCENTLATYAGVFASLEGEPPQVSVTAIANGNGANGNPAVFRFSRTGSTTAPLSVSYRLLGTAQAGSDYSGSSTVTIIAQIVPSPTAPASYVITPGQQTATATITAEGMVVTVNGPSSPGSSKGEIRNDYAFAA